MMKIKGKLLNTPKLVWNLALLFSFLLNIPLSQNAGAATASGALSISTLVTANCSLSSAILNFGNYDPISSNANTPLSGTTSFQIACTKGANVVIRLNSGLNGANASGTTRAMSAGDGHYLSYELYSDPGRTIVWSTTAPVQFTSTSSTGLTQTIYGRIPAGQNAFAGNYADTVTITATF